MPYSTRLIHHTLDSRSTKTRALLITGPRRSGKSTFARALLERWGGGSYYSFDTPLEQSRFTTDPEGFLNSVQLPVVLDEVQNVPSLFPYLKSRIDQSPEAPCDFILTGSQQFHMMSRVSESLAGRILLRELLPFSIAEASQTPYEQIHANITTLLTQRSDFGVIPHPPSEFTSGSIAKRIFFGGYPQVVQLSDPREAVDWFASYLETYVQRDVRSLSHLQDLSAFSRFTSLIAARTVCILNFSELGKDIGVNYKTAQHYSSIFEAGYLWRLLAPYHGNNVEKRLSKSPKGVMLDSGLAAFLMGFYLPDGIDKSPLFSQLFETLVISEFAKLFAGLNERVTLMHFRAGQTHEVDLILQHGQRLIPIEIKASGSPRADWGKGISVFRKTFGLPESCTGYVVSFGAKVEHLRENVWNLPLPLFY